MAPVQGHARGQALCEKASEWKKSSCCRLASGDIARLTVREMALA